MTRRKKDQRGWSSVTVAILLPAFVLLIGLVFDGGAKVAAVREAAAIASSAARAGGNAAAASIHDHRPPGAIARTAALRYLRSAGAAGTVTVRGRTITVTVTATRPALFLTVIGIETMSGTAQASARVIPVGAS